MYHTFFRCVCGLHNFPGQGSNLSSSSDTIRPLGNTLHFFWPRPQHMEVPGPGIEPVPQQWQCWILSPLRCKRTAAFYFFKMNFLFYCSGWTFVLFIFIKVKCTDSKKENHENNKVLVILKTKQKQHPSSGYPLPSSLPQRQLVSTLVAFSSIYLPPYFWKTGF